MGGTPYSSLADLFGIGNLIEDIFDPVILQVPATASGGGIGLPV